MTLKQRLCQVGIFARQIWSRGILLCGNTDFREEHLCEAVVVGWKPTAPTPSGLPRRRVLSLLHIAGPGIHFGLRLFGCKFVALLGVALELRALALDNIKFSVSLPHLAGILPLNSFHFPSI